MSKKLITLLSLTLILIKIYSQQCNPDSVKVRNIKAFETDNNISWELKNHEVYINSDCISNDKLLIHLGGSFGNPSQTTLFPTLAANNGFKVINLHYPNSVSATGACANNTDPSCFWKYRQEIIFGTDTSSEVSVDSNNCIYNRVLKLLIHLDNNYPSEGWNNFILNSNEIDWTNVLISGHSQGGGHAAFLGKTFETNRILMFAAPNDYRNTYSSPAPWISNSSLTNESSYFAFGNLYDDVVNYSKQYQIWNNMNLLDQIDSINVASNLTNYNNSNVLYTKDSSSNSFSGNHGSVITDSHTPLINGQPVFIPVWKYMLGIDSSFNEVFEIDFNLKTYPNPTNGILHIESLTNIKRVNIYTVSGQLLKSLNTNKSKFEIDLTNFNGLLFLEYQFENNKVKFDKVYVN